MRKAYLKRDKMPKELYALDKVDRESYPDIVEVYKSIIKLYDLLKNCKYEEVQNNVKSTSNLIKEIKDRAIKNKDEKNANIMFLLNLYVKALDSIGKFWQVSESLDYQGAWSHLQDALDSLLRIYDFLEDENNFTVAKILDYLERIEKLYPYVYFNSIETINKKKTCSICKKSAFSKECIHIAGNLYMGEMAYNIIEEAEFLGVSLVKNPADKHCIIFMNCDKQNIEKTPFKIIHFLINFLKYPLKDFKLELTKRNLPISYYANWSKTSLCPCGSEKPFEVCCYGKEFVENPHYNIIENGEINFNIN